MHGHLVLLHLAPLLAIVRGFSMNESPAAVISRRTSFSQTAALIGIATTTMPLVSNAEPTEETPRIVDRMGGLLERYTDATKGFSLFSPSGEYIKILQSSSRGLKF